MDILKPHQKNLLLEFIPTLKLDLCAWKLIEFQLTDEVIQSGFTIMKAAEHIYELCSDKQGKIYICNDREMIIFAKLGKQTNNTKAASYIAQTFPKGTCKVFVHEIDPDYGLHKLSFVFIKSPLQINKKQKAQSPTLIDRKSRPQNIAAIADDDMFMRCIAKEGCIKGRCKEVVEFIDGKNVVEGYKKYNPDILLLDIHLPHKSGPEILREILMIDPDAYIVMFSADNARDQVLDCLKKGAKGFITKPFTKEKLHTYINKCPSIS